MLKKLSTVNCWSVENTAILGMGSAIPIVGIRSTMMRVAERWLQAWNTVQIQVFGKVDPSINAKALVVKWQTETNKIQQKGVMPFWQSPW